MNIAAVAVAVKIGNDVGVGAVDTVVYSVVEGVGDAVVYVLVSVIVVLNVVH